MVVQYENGKIYKLTGITAEGKELIYIGSTTKILCQRLTGHVTAFKLKSNITSSQIIALGNYQITLLELYPCSCKDELTARERYYYDIFDCVNNRRPKSMDGEVEEYNKKYRIEKADTIKKQNKQYRLENADKYKHYRLENAGKYKQYRLDNADKIKDQNQIYYEENADKIKENNKQYRIENADKIKQNNKNYRLENAEKIQQYRLENADKIKEQQKQYRIDRKLKKTII